MKRYEKEYHATTRDAGGAETRARPSSPWQLVREVGLDYATGAAAGEPNLLLFPIAAERTKQGGYLIVDDVLQDYDPPRMQYRTLLLSAERDVLYDSSAQDVEDAYGCLMNDGQFAILRRARAELGIHSPTGELIRTIDLSGMSGRRPKIICWSSSGSFLVAFVAGRCDLDIVEFDSHGRVLWSCVDFIATIGIPSSMQPLADGSILIADEFHHVVWQLKRSGSSTIRWGNWQSPSSASGDLRRPRCAQLLLDGTLLIADSGNGRVVVVDRGGRASSLQLKNAALFSPASVRQLKGGSYLICDAGSRCVFELDSRGKCLPQYGSLKVRKRHLSFPRSVQHLRGDRYLVANAVQNTVVHIDRQEVRQLQINSMRGLFWPRAARKTKKGTVLIADGRNGRVLELSPDGNELRCLSQCRHNERFITLEDPHDVRLLSNDNLLIVDSQQSLVLEADWRGRAAWVIEVANEIRLADPHSAQQLSDGRIMISDTRNHRIVFVDLRTGLSESISEIRAGTTLCRLDRPRYAEVAPDGTLVIADAGNNRVLITDLAFSFLWILSCIPDSPIPYLCAPRWVQPIARDEIVISDYGNHRILHLRRRADS
jgi:hypothetical protein